MQFQKMANQPNQGLATLMPPSFGFDVPIQKKKNNTGLPDDLKSGIENLSGYAMDDVKVHYNSDKPAQLHAHAYAQGTDIHLGAGQEKHLPHEAWHVVQQKQGRVKPTLQMKENVAVNDDKGLEKEADIMGGKAVHNYAVTGANNLINSITTTPPPIQRLIKDDYPWNGIVINTSSLAVRSSPNKDSNNPHGNVIADLPTNATLEVISNSSGWLQVNIDTNSVSGIVLNSISRRYMTGSILQGYVGHRYIDEAVAHTLGNMVGDQATWNPSSPGSGTTFEVWASAASEGAAPAVDVVTTINCWEMVLLAAYNIGAIDWNWIHNLYIDTANWSTTLPSRMTSGTMQTYDPTTGTPQPSRGDIVFFNGASHVVLATGNGDSVYSFWVVPNNIGGTPSTPSNPNETQLTTIQELLDIMDVHRPALRLSPTDPINVTFGKPDW